jgi:hypothetical protein
LRARILLQGRRVFPLPGIPVEACPPCSAAIPRQRPTDWTGRGILIQY